MIYFKGNAPSCMVQDEVLERRSGLASSGIEHQL
jgi:hypothetical protein